MSSQAAARTVVVGFTPKYPNNYKPIQSCLLFERHHVVYDQCCPVQRVMKKLPSYYYPLTWEQKKQIENRLNWENERRERVV